MHVPSWSFGNYIKRTLFVCRYGARNREVRKREKITHVQKGVSTLSPLYATPAKQNKRYRKETRSGKTTQTKKCERFIRKGTDKKNRRRLVHQRHKTDSISSNKGLLPSCVHFSPPPRSASLTVFSLPAHHCVLLFCRTQRQQHPSRQPAVKKGGRGWDSVTIPTYASSRPPTISSTSSTEEGT
jgi:hypothetical protein